MEFDEGRKYAGVLTLGKIRVRVVETPDGAEYEHPLTGELENYVTDLSYPQKGEYSDEEWDTFLRAASGAIYADEIPPLDEGEEFPLDRYVDRYVTIRYKSAAVDVRFADGEWSYQNPSSGSWCDEPRMIMQGWSEQDPEEQAEWEYLISRISSDEDLWDLMDLSEDDDEIDLDDEPTSGPAPDHYTIEGYEVIEKRVTAFGNSCHIAMPRSWGGCTVKIVRISPKE